MTEIIETFQLSYGPPDQDSGNVTIASQVITLRGPASHTYTIDAGVGTPFRDGRISVQDQETGRYPMYLAGVGTKDSAGSYQAPGTGVTVVLDSLSTDGTTATAQWTFTIDGTDRVLTAQMSVVGRAVKVVLSGDSTAVNSNFCGAYAGEFSGADMYIFEGPGAVAFPTAYWTSAVGAGTKWFGHFLDITQSSAQAYSKTDPSTGALTSTVTTLDKYEANDTGAYPEFLGETLWCVASTDRSQTYVYPNDSSDKHAEVASGPWCFLTSEGNGDWAAKQVALTALSTEWGFEGLNAYPQYWWAEGNYGTDNEQNNGSFWKAADPAGQAAFGAALRNVGFNVGGYTYPSLEKMGTGDGTAGTYNPEYRVLEADGTARVSEWGSEAAGVIADQIDGSAGSASSVDSPEVTITSTAAAKEFKVELFVEKEGASGTEAAIQAQLLVAATPSEQFTAWVDTNTGVVRSVVAGVGSYSSADVTVVAHDDDANWWRVELRLSDTAGTADAASASVFPYETGGTTVGVRDITISDFAVWDTGVNLVPEAYRTDFAAWTLSNGATVTSDAAEGPRRVTYMTKHELVGAKYESIFGDTGGGLAQALYWNMVRFDVDTYSDVSRAGGDYVDLDSTSSSQTLKTALQERRRWMYEAKAAIGTGAFTFGEGGRATHFSDYELLWAGAVDSWHSWWNTNSGYDETDQINYPDGKSISQWPMMIEHERECRASYGTITNNNPARFFTVWEQGLQDEGISVIYPHSRAMVDRLRCYAFALVRTGGIAYVDNWTWHLPEREVVKEYYLTNRACQRQVAVRDDAPAVRYYDDTEGYETEEARWDRNEQLAVGRGRTSFVESTKVRVTQGTVTVWVNRSDTDWVIPTAEVLIGESAVTLPADGFLCLDSSDGAVMGSFSTEGTGGVRVDAVRIPGQYTLVDGRGTELSLFGVLSEGGRLVVENYAGGFTLTENADLTVTRGLLTSSSGSTTTVPATPLPSPAASNSMTRLEAVNLILAGTGDDPVASLADEASADSLAAEQRLDAEDREVQSHGWYFNTYERTYSPDVNGRIAVPGTVMYVDGPEGTRYSVQNGVLYDILNNTKTFSSSVTLVVVERLPWDSLPEPAKQYIVAVAARRYADRQLTDPALSRFLREDEERAFITLKKAHVRAGNFSIFGPRERAAFLRGGPYSLS